MKSHRTPLRARTRRLLAALTGAAALAGMLALRPPAADAASGPLSVHAMLSAWTTFFPPGVLIALGILIAFSAFFSGSETAFFSIHKLRLRAMREEKTLTGRRVARMMDHPARLLTTILLGNMTVNTLVGVLLGARVERWFQEAMDFSAPLAYAVAVAAGTAFLVFFGEVTPKVFAVHTGERFARVASIPLGLIDRLLAPVRDGVLYITDGMFRIARFHELRAAPFITDEELKAVLTDGEATGVIEEDERQMIQGILDFTDATLREILVPRPDVVALPEDTTVGEALTVVREHEYSRMPVFKEDLDHVVGLLVAKDLLPCVVRGERDKPIRTLVRPAHFVPETMTVQQFVATAQRHHAHLAVVVDEYGGTAGIVTLEDAIEQVVGDLLDEDEHEHEGWTELGPSLYRAEGAFPLDELNEIIGASLEDDEHQTVAGFVMNLIDKVPEPGDEIECQGVRFTVEACEGKRVTTLKIHVLPPVIPAQEHNPA